MCREDCERDGTEGASLPERFGEPNISGKQKQVEHTSNKGCRKYWKRGILGTRRGEILFICYIPVTFVPLEKDNNI